MASEGYSVSVRFALLFLSLILSNAFANKGSVVFIYLLDAGARSIINSDVLAKKYSRILKMQHPDKKVHILKAKDTDTLSLELSKIGEDEKISHLYIRGHGSSNDNFVTLSNSSNKIFLKMHFQKDNDQDNQLRIIQEVGNSSSSLKKIGRKLTEDSIVYYMSCSTVSGESKLSCLKASTISNVLGMKSGYLIAYNTPASEAIETYLETGIKGDLKVKLVKGMMLSELWFIALPFITGFNNLAEVILGGSVVSLYGLAYYFNRYIFNKGSIFKVENGIVELIKKGDIRELREFFLYGRKGTQIPCSELMM